MSLENKVGGKEGLSGEAMDSHDFFLGMAEATEIHLISSFYL